MLGRSPLVAALFQRFQFLPPLRLLHTLTHLHKQFGFNLQQVPQTVKNQEKKKCHKISVKTKLETPKVEFIHRFLDTFNIIIKKDKASAVRNVGSANFHLKHAE